MENEGHSRVSNGAGEGGSNLGPGGVQLSPRPASVNVIVNQEGEC